MTTYIEIVEALIKARYLSNTDLDNATEVLAHVPITNSDAQNKKAVALTDEVYQYEMIRQADELIADDEVINAYEDEALQIKTIEAAVGQIIEDESEIVAAEVAIASAYHDVAAALVGAGLIDAANVEAVVGVIQKVG